MIFAYGFYGLCSLCIAVYFYTKAKLPISDDPQFVGFQRSYMTVYLMAVAGDWLQGPHVYVLYDLYGMSKHQIEVLFIAGFGSSMIFGTFIGSIADKYGRKTNCFLYGLLYSCACVTKHFADFNVLLIGRLLGGMATSILCSAFESWLIFEHNKRGFSEELLTTIFSHSTLGNSLVAIVAGVVAQFVADTFGFVAPFDVSIVMLFLMCIVMICTWPENFGDQKATVQRTFFDAWHLISNDRKILSLGLIQSLFEGSMYTFVLEWTPILTNAQIHTEMQLDIDHRNGIPHGHIFASFMMAIMIGSSLFKILSKYVRPESFMRNHYDYDSFCMNGTFVWRLPHFMTYLISHSASSCSFPVDVSTLPCYFPTRYRSFSPPLSFLKSASVFSGLP